ncbi:hypothetical protein DXG01_005783 [Tephrocybe rancida]|nr:hypothetical protein DXG01_005783 [Tephrocybe rancida]
MSTLRITIDDISPLIDYQPTDGWLQKNSTTDTVGINYHAETFTRATQLGASASFTFNGTSITIYGGKSPNHGNYTINVDGKKQDASGFASTNQYQIPIFSADNLGDSTHTVSLTNTQYAFVDIDYYNVYLGSIGALQIHSSAVSLYGTVGPNNGAFSVELDGLPATTYQGSKTTYATQTLLFHASDLGYQDHTMVITSTQNANLEIDYALIHNVDGSSSSSPAGVGPDTTSGGGNNSGGNSSSKASLTPAAIAGIAGGIITIAGLLVALCVLVRVNKTLLARLKRGYRVQSQFTSTLSSASQHSAGLTSTTGNFTGSTADTETGYHVASDTKSSPREFMTALTVANRDSRELLVSPARPLSIGSNMSSVPSTASTLVAEDGSTASSGRRRFRFKMATIPSVPDLLDLRSIISDANSDVNIPVMSPSHSSSPTASVSYNSHLASSDAHGFWDQFIQPETANASPTPDIFVAPSPARVSSPTYEFEWIGPRPRGTPVLRTREGTPEIQLPQVPPPVASRTSFGRDSVRDSPEPVEWETAKN